MNTGWCCNEEAQCDGDYYHTVVVTCRLWVDKHKQKERFALL